MEAPAATGTLNATRTSNEQMAIDERTTECLSGMMDITISCGHDDVGGKNVRVEVTRRAIEMMGGPPGRLLVFRWNWNVANLWARRAPCQCITSLIGGTSGTASSIDMGFLPYCSLADTRNMKPWCRIILSPRKFSPKVEAVHHEHDQRSKRQQQQQSQHGLQQQALHRIGGETAGELQLRIAPAGSA